MADLTGAWAGGCWFPTFAKEELYDWEEVVCGIIRSVEATSGDSAENIEERMRSERRAAEEAFDQRGPAGLSYQYHAAAYYACKVCLDRRRRGIGVEEACEAFRRETLADRIIQNHYTAFSKFYAEEVFALSGEDRTEETDRAMDLLQFVRDRYDLWDPYWRVLKETEELERELDAIPFYRDCLEADAGLDRAKERLEGEKIPAEELRQLVEQMGTWMALYNQHHEEAEAAAEPVLERLGELRREILDMETRLNREVPHDNEACSDERWSALGLSF